MADIHAAELRTARSIKVAGEVATLSFRVRDAVDPAGPPPLDLSPEQRAELVAKVSRSVRKGLLRGYDVALIALDEQQGTLTFSLSGVRFMASITPGFRSGRVLEGAILASLRRGANAIREYTTKGTSAPAVLAKWSPGSGITLDRDLLAPDAPEAEVRARISETAHRERWIRYGAIFFAFLGTIGAAAFAIVALAGETGESAMVGATIGLFYGAVAVLVALSLRNRAIDLRDEVRALRDDLDLRAVRDEEPEVRAQKLFQVHSNELKRYYDQALRQRGVIFAVGILCILAGFAVVGVALSLVDAAPANDATRKIVIGGLGAVGALLANFVAVVYLRMFSGTVRSMGDFHNRLVVTHHVHFANFLAAKIEKDEALRENTLAAMAVALAERDPPAPPGGEADKTADEKPAKG